MKAGHSGNSTPINTKARTPTPESKISYVPEDVSLTKYRAVVHTIDFQRKPIRTTPPNLHRLRPLKIRKFEQLQESILFRLS